MTDWFQMVAVTIIIGIPTFMCVRQRVKDGFKHETIWHLAFSSAGQSFLIVMFAMSLAILLGNLVALFIRNLPA